MSDTSKSAPRVLILETDRRFGNLLLKAALKGWEGASVQSIGSSLGDLATDSERLRSFDVILAGCDFGEDGSSQSPALVTLRALAADPGMPPVILLTEGGSEYCAVQAMKAGAFDYLPKSVFSRDQIVLTVNRALACRSRPGQRAVDDELQVFGYEMRRCLARTDNASIHTAFSAEQQKEVVIKILKRGRGSLSRDTRFARFLDEFKILHDIDDPAVAEIHDFRVTNRFSYIAMEYFALGHLGGVMREPLPPHEAFRITIEIANALSIIHMAGVVHLDLKPANIMLRDDGTVGLIDFGISKSASMPSADGQIISGTPYYMSPEQAAGGETDERSDLYSLGVILFQMLTGEKPFSGKDADEILKAQRESPIPELPAESAAAQALLERLLAKNPDDRITSARELTEVIARLPEELVDADYALSASSA